jgi:hypothetical protein
VTNKRPENEHHAVEGLLDDWREAERDAQGEEPDSAARKMARQRADMARGDFHEAEDLEREHQGDHRLRKSEPTEEEHEASEGSAS